MLSQQERNRIYDEITAVRSRIGQIGAEIGRCRNQINSLKDDKTEYRDLHRVFSKENARRERLTNRGNYIRTDDNHVGVVNTERIMFNIQCSIDSLYTEIDKLYREKNELYAKKNKLYEQLQAR